jgi:hypothetical protein
MISCCQVCLRVDVDLELSILVDPALRVILWIEIFVAPQNLLMSQITNCCANCIRGSNIASRDLDLLALVEHPIIQESLEPAEDADALRLVEATNASLQVDFLDHVLLREEEAQSHVVPLILLLLLGFLFSCPHPIDVFSKKPHILVRKSQDLLGFFIPGCHCGSVLLGQARLKLSLFHDHILLHLGPRLDMVLAPSDDALLVHVERDLVRHPVVVVFIVPLFIHLVLSEAFVGLLIT